MKCKYIKTCKLYNKLSLVCNSDGGMYYGDEDDPRPAGCYRDMEEKELKSNGR